MKHMPSLAKNISSRLMGIIDLLLQRLRCCWLWFSSPSYLRRSRKLPHPISPNHAHTPQKPEWLKAEILRLKALMPEAGCRTIADICNRRFAATRHTTVGKTYVHQLLQRHRYEIQGLRRGLKRKPPKTYPRNYIWGVDLTGKTDTQGTLQAILGIIDHGSRKLLHLQAVSNKTSIAILAGLKDTIHTLGKPQAIRTDNEAIFTSSAFRLGLKRLGIRHQRTTPGCPWQNGRIERLFGTLKQKLDQWQVPDIAQLHIDLAIFRHWYNHIRPHQSLNGQTPDEAWHGINPYKTIPRHENWFTAWEGLLTGYDLRC